MQTTLFALGLILFLLGLITGLLVPVLKNPRMGLAGHLGGMTNGPFLIIAGYGQSGNEGESALAATGCLDAFTEIFTSSKSTSRK